MWQTIKNVTKNAVLLAVVGVALAYATPLIGEMLMPFLDETAKAATESAIAQHLANPLWTGAFFGGFGALHALAEPVAQWIFGEHQVDTTTPAQSCSVCKGHGQDLAPSQPMEPERSLGVRSNFAAQVEARRATSDTQPTLGA